MSYDAFEWDVAKAAANFAKHGVSFEHAKLVFADPCAVDGYDDRFDYGEDRHFIVGMIQGALIFVGYAERGDKVRIISARRATKHEQDDYFEQSQG